MDELATEDGSLLATAGAPPATAHATTRQRPMMIATTLPDHSRQHPLHLGRCHEPVPTLVTTQCEAFGEPAGPVGRSVTRSSTGTSEVWPIWWSPPSGQ